METILFEKIKLPQEEKLFRLQDFVLSYQRIFRDSEYMDEINHMKNEIENAITSMNNIRKEKYEKVKQSLYRYWKVNKLDDMGHLTPVMYIFPYKFNESNQHLFALCSYIKPEYNSNNGLHEDSFDIMEHQYFSDYDLLFEETTEEEMMTNAMQSCQDALSERLWKLKYRDHVLE